MGSVPQNRGMEREKMRISGARLRATRNTESSMSCSSRYTAVKSRPNTSRMWRVSPYCWNGKILAFVGSGIAIRISATTIAASAIAPGAHRGRVRVRVGRAVSVTIVPLLRREHDGLQRLQGLRLERLSRDRPVVRGRCDVRDHDRDGEARDA